MNPKLNIAWIVPVRFAPREKLTKVLKPDGFCGML